MKKFFSNLLEKTWYQSNPWFYLFAPFSWIYRMGASLKKLAYQSGIKKTTQFPVPIIVVGNITVGGTGKTPLVIALTHFLIQHGKKPGIVSRGYGAGKNKKPLRVWPDSDSSCTGDEPLLIARATKRPVVIARQRVAAVHQLLENSDCNIIISDDGLQHDAMDRDIEIAVIDGERRFGNGLCLPAGPLREPISRLEKVDFRIAQGEEPRANEWSMHYIPGEIYNLLNPSQTLTSNMCQKPIHAVAGIGNPQRFFKQLAALGFNVIAHPFPDHHAYAPDELNFGADCLIVMTEKDAVKCEKFADSRYWCLPIRACCDPVFLDLLWAKVQSLEEK